MDKLTLKAAKRTVKGRKVKKLRADGKLPASVYGNKIKSESVEVAYADFKKVYQNAGETKIVDLVLGTGEARPVLIHRVQIQPVTGSYLHADFYQVNLKEKVRTKVPIELMGVSPAVGQKKGLLLQTLNEVEIEALPRELPEKLVIDITSLAEVGQEVKVSDLKIPEKVTIFADKEIVVVKVGALVSKEAEEIAAQEEAAAAAAKAESQEVATTGATTSAETPAQPAQALQNNTPPSSAEKK